MRRGLIPVAFAISALLSLVAFAQTPPAPTRSAPQTAPTSIGGAGSQGKIVLINTAAFRAGIGELKTKLEALNKEFEPQSKELEGLQKQINDLKTKVQTQSQAVQPSVRDGWMQQGAELEKALKRKSEDYQTFFQKRGQEMVAPIMDKINKFLGEYSRQHNIVLVLDRGIAQSSNLLVWAAPVTEITEDFIKEYNKANLSQPGAAPAAKKQ